MNTKDLKIKILTEKLEKISGRKVSLQESKNIILKTGKNEIGKTKSGKIVYNIKSKKLYFDFTEKDFFESEEIVRNIVKLLDKEIKKVERFKNTNEEYLQDLNKSVDYFVNLEDYFYRRAKAKQNGLDVKNSRYPDPEKSFERSNIY